jgi:hypothetical protein
MTKEIQIFTTEPSDISKFDMGNIIERPKIKAEDLNRNLKEFLESLSPVFENNLEIGKFDIEEIELALVVNAKGGFELLGKVEAGVEASIKLKLKPKTKNA